MALDWDQIRPTHRLVQPEEFKVYHFLGPDDDEMLPEFIYKPRTTGTYKRPYYRVQSDWEDHSTRIEVGDWVVLEHGEMYVYTDKQFHETFEVME